MRRRKTIVAFVMLVLLLGGQAAGAGSDSKFAIKLDFGVSGYPSDQDMTVGPYTAIDDSPAILDSRSIMLYHFDRKFGRTVYGALDYGVTRNLELEIGFAYTDMQLEITQHYGLGVWRVEEGTPRFGYDRTALDSKKDNDFSIMTLRPGANFTLSSSRIVPYIGAGLNIMVVSARTTLDFLRPYVVEEAPGHYVLYSGKDGKWEELNVDGRQIAFGLDLRSGLEFRISPAFSATFGVSYLFQFQKAFSDFEKYVEDNPADAAVAGSHHYFDGMNLTNVSFSLGVIAHL